MLIEIQAQGMSITPSLRDRIRRRLQFALHHGSDRITRVTVRLADINGPKGGRDKRCHITVSAGRLKDIVVEEVQADLDLAINRTVDRVKHTLERRLDQKRVHLQGGRGGPGLRAAVDILASG